LFASIKQDSAITRNKIPSPAARDRDEEHYSQRLPKDTKIFFCLLKRFYIIRAACGRVSTMLSFAIGVDLGGTNLRIAAVEETGKLLKTFNTTTELSRGRDFVIGEMCSAIRELAEQFRVTHHFAGTGVGIPGIIEMETSILRSAANLPDWNNCPVKAEIEARLGSPVVLENDANCAALGEKWIGAGRDAGGLCMITLGTGVGGALILRDEIWHGMIGMAGEIGHMNVVAHGPECGCGGRGCLEQFASATAIRRMAAEAVRSGNAPSLAQAVKQGELSAKLVFEQAMLGDAVAKQIFETVGAALGTVLASLVNALNLPIYVIGGGVGNAWPAFSPAMFRELRRQSVVFRAAEDSQTHVNRTLITQAQLGNEAGLIGAARLPLLLEVSHHQCCRTTVAC
jgi:glucokinase